MSMLGWRSVALAQLVGLERVARLLLLLALKQRLQRHQLREDAACRPRVDAAAVMCAAQQQLRGAVPAAAEGCVRLVFCSVYTFSDCIFYQ